MKRTFSFHSELMSEVVKKANGLVVTKLNIAFCKQ